MENSLTIVFWLLSAVSLLLALVALSQSLLILRSAVSEPSKNKLEKESSQELKNESEASRDGSKHSKLRAVGTS